MSEASRGPVGVMATACMEEEARRNTGNPGGGRREFQLAAREGKAGPFGDTERSIVPVKSTNIDGGKGPWFKGTQGAARNWGIGMSLRTPAKVQELQTALHAKAKREPKYRFYALYDKVHRGDVLGYAYELCRAHAGAPGVDGQTFADIEAYGQERWLGELASDVTHRLRQWLCRKHKKAGLGTSRYPAEYLYQTLGLICLPRFTRSFSWAKA